MSMPGPSSTRFMREWATLTVIFRATSRLMVFIPDCLSLACFAYLESAGFDLDRSQESPDFLALARGDVSHGENTALCALTDRHCGLRSRDQ